MASNRALSTFFVFLAAFLSIGIAGTGSRDLAAEEDRPMATSPDLVIIDGKVTTGDPDRPFVEAISIRGGRIERLGDSKEIRSLAGKETRVLSIRGGFVFPGFIDAHAHIASLGRSLRSLDLTATRSFDEVVARVRERAAGTPKGEWIVGRGWDQNDWKVKAFPTHDRISEAAPDNPVWIVRIGGHAGLANHAALQITGITKSTADPAGGKILRDGDAGEATGLLVDAAMDLVSGRIPAIGRERIRKDILSAQQACLEVGLTEVHDAGIDAETISIYRDLDSAGLLKIRIYAMASGDLGRLKEIFEDGPVLPGPEKRFTLRAVKVVADGALGSRGAAPLEDYSDDEGNRGLITISRDELLERVRWAISAGVQVGTHTIGDAATRLALDVYEEAMKGHEGPSPRLRVEHAQVIAAVDIPRFVRLGVIPSMQPTHCTSDMPWAEDRVGPSRLVGAYAWRTLLDTGARIAAGSDFPVESPNPLWGIYAAITRQDHQGKPDGGWRPAQRMNREEAIRSFTLDAAYASFEEEKKGMIAEGWWADLVVLDRDILSITASEILKARVRANVIGGTIVFEAGS